MKANLDHTDIFIPTRLSWEYKSSIPLNINLQE